MLARMLNVLYSKLGKYQLGLRRNVRVLTEYLQCNTIQSKLVVYLSDARVSKFLQWVLYYKANIHEENLHKVGRCILSRDDQTLTFRLVVDSNISHKSGR